ncbi:MAG: type II toxin-antitoxin system VapC family toxin [Planctomycetes bacterium]|nr:type II toxin-antitoxin system VapC family toxin [Planctomycetota bacterium]
MNPLLLDTNAYVAFKRGDSEAVEILQQAPAIYLNAVVLGELLAGFAAGNRTDFNRAQLQEFLDLSKVSVLQVDRDTATVYGEVFASLRLAGTPIPTNDMWIAASAIQSDLALFSFDSHFRAVSGLACGASRQSLGG